MALLALVMMLSSSGIEPLHPQSQARGVAEGSRAGAGGGREGRGGGPEESRAPSRPRSPIEDAGPPASALGARSAARPPAWDVECR